MRHHRADFLQPRRLGISVSIVALCALLACSARANIVIGAFGAGRSERPFSGPDYSNIRSRLSNPANFGPGGIVPEAVTFAPDVSTVTPASLSGLDIFVVTEVGSLSAAEQTALRDFVLTGHCLYLTSNSTASGRPGASLTMQALDGGSLGDPTGGDSGSNVGSIVASGVATNGPFGNLPLGSSFAATPGSTLNPGSSTTVIGRTAGNTFNIMAQIAPNALGAGSGPVLITSDVIFMNFFVPPASIFPNENNAILFENFVAYHGVPEPATAGILATAASALACRRSRRDGSRCAV